jgi:hypothetical protein
MIHKLIALKERYVRIISDNNTLIQNSDISDMTITRLLIEKNCYFEFIKQIDKILENESVSNCKNK